MNEPALSTPGAPARGIRRALGIVEKLLRLSVAGLVITIVIMVAGQVVFRYAIQKPIVWSEEFTTLSYQWLSFLGAALAVRYRAHFGVDFFVRLLHPGSRVPLIWLGHAVVWLIAAFMIVYGWRIVELSAAQMYPTLPFSVGTGYLILPISGVLFLLMDWGALLERRDRREGARP